MSQNILGRRIFVITSHPDDESFLCAGVIHRNFLAGGETYLACATLGEKGNSHLNRPTSKKALKERRKKELFSAGKFLHISKIYCLGFPDGGLRGVRKEYYKKCLKIVKQVNPEVILGFGPEGITGHYDHVTSGNIAKQISKKLRIPFYVFSLAPKLLKAAEAQLNSRTKKDYYLSEVTFTKSNYRISIDPKIKIKAIGLHKSQLENKKTFTGFSKFLAGSHLKYEYFKKS